MLYLAAIFDPIFTLSQTGSRLVCPVSLEAALAGCFDITAPPPFNPHEPIELSDLVKQNKGRVIVVFPEATTSNGRGILKFSQSLLSASPDTKIFPVSLRYTPADIVTPIPGWLEAIRFIWRLNSRPTHCIRVRIGAPITVSSAPQTSDSPGTRSKTAAKSSSRASTGRKTGFESNFFDTLQSSPAEKVAGDEGEEGDEEMSEQEGRVLDAVSDTLARLGRVKRVGLGVEEKRGFVDAWWKRRNYR